MKAFTISQAAAACQGRMSRADYEDRELGHVVVDSRKVQPGDLFVAYKGEKVDGHDYIAAAFNRGAACCLAERLPEGEERAVLLVPDVQKALEQIALAYRATLSLPVVGVTGSVGKTSAKEMIAAVLAQRFRVLKTEGNLNNQIGVPMTISRIEPEHEVAVVELGISGFGEMTDIARLAQPRMAVFTRIGHAHLEMLGDLDGVFRAKTELLPFLPEDGGVVVNGDDPYLRALRCPQRRILVGLGAENDLRAEEIRYVGEERTDFTLVWDGGRVPVTIPAYGQHLVYAALEGAAVGLTFGLGGEEIAAGIASFRTVGRRGAMVDTGFLTLIDDSYNANPDSVQCGIDSLLQLPGRHVAILGDMRELGEGGADMHRAIGRYAREKGVDLLLTAGPLARCFAEGAGERAHWFETREALIAALPTFLQKGDSVLVKASLRMGFSAVAEAVKQL